MRSMICTLQRHRHSSTSPPSHLVPRMATRSPCQPYGPLPCLPPSHPQWFKAYWDQVTVGQPIGPYDGPSRRAVCKTGDFKTSGGAAGGAKAVGRSVPTSSSAPVRAAAAPAVRAAPTNSGSRAVGGGAGDRDQVDKLANQLEVGVGQALERRAWCCRRADGNNSSTHFDSRCYVTKH